MPEQIKRVLGQYGASAAFKQHQTLRQLIVAAPHKIPTEEEANVVYRHLKSTFLQVTLNFELE